MKADGHTGKDIAKYLGVSRANLYRYLSAAAAASFRQSSDWPSAHTRRFLGFRA
jgi:AcrR family transcriptional regulator